MKNPTCFPGWEVPHCWPVLLGCARASCVTHSWALTLSGLGLLSGRGSKRLSPQLPWQTAGSGAAWDRRLALGWGHRAPGAPGEGSHQWVSLKSLALHWPTRFWASPCPPWTMKAGGRAFPYSALARALCAAWKPWLLDRTEKGQPWPPGGTSGSEGLRTQGRHSVLLANPGTGSN